MSEPISEPISERLSNEVDATVCWREEGMVTYVPSSPGPLTPPKANQGLGFEISYLSFESTYYLWECKQIYLTLSYFLHWVNVVVCFFFLILLYFALQYCIGFAIH